MGTFTFPEVSPTVSADDPSAEPVAVIEPACQPSSSTDTAADMSVSLADLIAAANGIVPVDSVSVDMLVGKYCIVKHNGKPYPLIVLSVEEFDVEIKCMTRIGNNRYFWPNPIEAICWYQFHDIISLIPQPRPIGTKTYQVNLKLWNVINAHI